MRVFVVRHCEAAPGEVDALRPLTTGGRAAARALAERLAAAHPDAVLCSPLLRARETAAAIAVAAGVEAEPDDRLSPGMTVDALTEATQERGDAVVVVAHNPDCADVVQRLLGTRAAFAPGTVVEVEL